MKKQLLAVWEAIGSIGKSVLLIGALYNFALTAVACFLITRHTIPDFLAAKEIVYIAASLMNISVVAAVFSEAYQRRFLGK